MTRGPCLQLTQRKVSNAAGWGFRNYWFTVAKDAEGALSKFIQSCKAQEHAAIHD